jgi:uncharacterized membrane protein
MNVPFTGFARLIRRPRLLGAGLLSACVFALLCPLMPRTHAMLLAFDAGALAFLVLMAILMQRATPQAMHRRAQIQNEGKWITLLTALSIAAVVMGALASELHAASVKSLTDVALACTTILLAWLFVAVMFAQQYAHQFYLVPGQLAFPGTPTPDYWDFTYFALVINMCCQTSDVTVNSGSMRKLVMLHSMVAFFFNVIIIAITVNVVAGVL